MTSNLTRIYFHFGLCQIFSDISPILTIYMVRDIFWLAVHFSSAFLVYSYTRSISHVTINRFYTSLAPFGV